MADPLCSLMGILDIIAGILIIASFTNPFGIAFGIFMIGKGGVSFI